MKGLNFSKFKKINEDERSATLMHERGHNLLIAKNALSPLQRKQLENLKMHAAHYAEGGTVELQDMEDPEMYEDTEEGDRSPAAVKKKKPQGPMAGLKSPLSADNKNLANMKGAEGMEAKAEQTRASKDAAVYDSLIQNELAQQEAAQAVNTQGAPNLPTYQFPLSQNGMQNIPAAPYGGLGGQEMSQQLGQVGTPLNNPDEAPVQEAPYGGLGGKQMAQELGEQTQRASQMDQYIQSLPTEAETIGALKARDEQLFQLAKNGEINPERYWNDHSKWGAALGVLISGLGQVMAGGSNTALEQINKAIDRDIDAQKANRDRVMNLFQMNEKMLGNKIAANLTTRNQMATIAKWQLEKNAAESKGAIAKAKFLGTAAELQKDIDANNFKLSLMTPSKDNLDPSRAVQALVPPEQQKRVLDEIDAHKKMVEAAPTVMKAFDQAVKETTLKSGFSPRSLIGMNTAGQHALKILLPKLIQDKEGSVTEAKMSYLIDHAVPALTDTPDQAKTKREFLAKYMAEGVPNSAATEYGLQLQKFPMTNTHNIIQQYGEVKEINPTKNGVPYERKIINGKAYMVPVRKK